MSLQLNAFLAQGPASLTVEHALSIAVDIDDSCLRRAQCSQGFARRGGRQQRRSGNLYLQLDAINQFDKMHMARVLEHTHQDRKEAAKLMDISLCFLYRKIEDLGIS